MENLKKFIETLASGESVAMPQMDENEVRVVIDLAVHSTNFLGNGGIDGYEKLLNKLYTQIVMDHGKGTAETLFSKTKDV